MELKWFRLDTNTHRNPKVIRLIRNPRGGPMAAHIWLAMIEYAVSWNLAGTMTKAQIEDALPNCVKPVHLALLESDGFIHRTECGEYVIHDFTEYQAGADVARVFQEKATNAARARWDKHNRAKLRPIRGGDDG